MKYLKSVYKRASVNHVENVFLQPTTMASSQPRIAIIGSGPSGLTLGALLHKRNVPFTIFELQERPTEEQLARPAGSLDLHEHTGLAALEECGLLEQFHALPGECTEAQILSDKHGNVLYADKGEGRNRPEISRHQLVKLLLPCLPESAFKWRHKLLSAKRLIADSGQAEIELDFGPNGKHTFDLVVGADGAWSKIRAMLTDVKPQYAGTQNITLNLGQVGTSYPHLAKLIGTGTFTSLGNRHGVFSQRSVDDSARIYIFMSSEDEHFATTTGVKDKTPAQAKAQILGDSMPFTDWAPTIRELVAAACDDESTYDPNAKLDIKPLYNLPIGHTWVHQSGATVIGDASHLMCPWAGEGVNLAMRDALALSRVIVKAHEQKITQDELDSLIKDFEVEMVAEAKEEAIGTKENGEMMFGSDDGAEAMSAFFREAMAGHRENVVPRPE